MEYVLVVYGAAFLATGAALGVQARTAEPGASLPRSALWALTAFAVVHGASDWALLGLEVERREHGVLVAHVAVARLVLLAASFAVLGTFGLLLVVRRGRRGRWPIALGAPAVLLAAWGAVAAVALRARAGAIDGDAVATAEAATRYALGLPACAAAIAGLDRVRRRMRAEDWRAARYVSAAALAMAAYAVLACVVVPAAHVGLAPTLNAGSFHAATRVPVELLRAAAIGLAGLLVSEVFVRATSAHLHREVEHLRDDFVALVAHDLRTPLNAVVTGTALLDRLRPEEHESEREARIVRAVRSSALGASKIVGDLLDASRIESRRLSVSPERLDLVPLLLRLVEWAPAEAMRSHTVRLVPPGPLPPVLADPVRVEQVLANLLSNAGKYSPAGSEIVLEAGAGPGEVTVSVTNAGKGIPPRDLPRVFSRSFRTTSARSGRAPGLGLGLYIAKGLVESQGGRIWAESDPGRRTTFSFTLPRAPAEGRGARPAQGEAISVGEERSWR